VTDEPEPAGQAPTGPVQLRSERATTS
jgi:hypothetical protein